MNAIIFWFAQNRVAANLMMLVIFALGLLAIPDTRKELIPNVSLDQISISISYPGASPETVEKSVCQRMENAISDIEGLIDLTAFAYESVCVVNVNIAEGFLIAKLLEHVKNQIEAIENFPNDVEKPVIKELKVRNRVAKLIISGPAQMWALKRLAENIRNDLLKLASISVVDLEDVKPNQIFIEVSQINLQRYNLSFNELANVIQSNSLEFPSGELNTESGDILISSIGKIEQADHFEDLIIRASKEGSRVRLGDLAIITDERQSEESLATFDGEASVSLDIYRVGDQNIVEVANSLRQYVAKKNLPSGVVLYIWQDDSKHFKSRSHLLLKNAASGLLLLFTILLLFLNVQLSFWVSLGIPIAFLGAFWMLPLFDESINIVSLFAFILVLGIVVDDAVVVGESIYSQHQAGYPGLKGAVRGAQRVAKPVIFAVLTSIIAFIPMLFLPGSEGKLIRVVPIVVISTLIFSLIESLFILPAHLSSISSDKNKKLHRLSPVRLQKGFSFALTQLIIRIYQPLLWLVLRYKGRVIGIFVVIFILNALLLSTGWIRVKLFTSIEADIAVANIAFAHGTPASRTREAITKLESAAISLMSELEAEIGEPVIIHIYTVVGPRNKSSNARDFSNRDHRGRVTIELSSSETRTINGSEIVQRWREKVGSIRGALLLQFNASLNPSKPDINIEFSGQDLTQLEDVADAFKQQLAAFDGVYEIQDSMQGGKQEVKLQLKPVARDLGLSLSDMGLQVRQAFHGVEVQNIQRGEEEVKVWLRYPEAERDSLWHLENMRIDLPGQDSVPLLAVADIYYDDTSSNIKRYEKSRVISISAFVDSDQNNADQIVSQLEKEFLEPLMENTSGISWSVAGQQKRIKQFLTILKHGYLLALLGMYLLMAVLFSSYSQPVLIMMAIPFGLLGSFFGHLLLDINITLWSFIGMVAVSGVVVNDNLVLVDYINKHRKQGVDLLNAVCKSGVARFRPIILTSLTTFVGLLPLISETSIQAQFLIPMAVSLAFGVMFATLVSLLLVPAFYLVLNDLKRPLDIFKNLVLRRPYRECKTLDEAYEYGFWQAMTSSKQPSCPFSDEVLACAWEAGWFDAQSESNSGVN